MLIFFICLLIENVNFFIYTVNESKKFSRITKKIISDVGCKEVTSNVECKKIINDVSCKKIAINVNCKKVTINISVKKLLSI
jgi:hypothetical protein